jgi:hypothetical protein
MRARRSIARTSEEVAESQHPWLTPAQPTIITSVGSTESVAHSSEENWRIKSVNSMFSNRNEYHKHKNNIVSGE